MQLLFKGARTGDPIEARLARLEDIESIGNLKAMYAHWCDHGYDADQLAALFAEDAVWDSNLFGPFEGREAIRGYFEELAKGDISWAHHCMIAPVIEVHEGGVTARGTWYLLDLATFTSLATPGEKDAVIATANYEDTFIKQGGEWKFSRVTARFHQISNLDQGWARQQFRGERPEGSAIAAPMQEIAPD